MTLSGDATGSCDCYTAIADNNTTLFGQGSLQLVSEE